MTESADPRSVSASWVSSLTRTPLASVLRRIALEELSGDLQVTSGKIIKTVYFDRGFVVFASSNLKKDRLGERMIASGRISRRDSTIANMLMQSRREKFGQALVSAGIISEEELGQHVASQVNSIVLSLFSFQQGNYAFDERPCPIPVELMVSLSVYRISIEGVRRMRSKTLVLAGLPHIDTRVRVTDMPPFTFDVRKLLAIEKKVLRVAGTEEGKSICKIVAAIDEHSGKVLRACYGLLSGGVLEPVGPEKQGARLRVQEETGAFVLSEIRRKVGVPERLASTAPETASRASESPADPPPAAQPSGAAEPAAPTRAREVSTATVPCEAGRGAGVLPWLMGVWSRLVSAVRDWLSAAPPTIELPPPRREAPTELLETSSPPPSSVSFPPSPVSRAKPATAPASTSPTIESIGVPSWSIASDPVGTSAAPTVTNEEPVVETLGAPSWSMVDDPNDAFPEDDPQTLIDSLGVPSWSMADDPRDAVQLSATTDTLDAEEGPGSAASRVAFAPSWSLMDPATGTIDQTDAPAHIELEEDDESADETDLPAATYEDESQPLAEMDSELFVEAEFGASLMNAIPIESIADPSSQVHETEPRDAPDEVELEVPINIEDGVVLEAEPGRDDSAQTSAAHAAILDAPDGDVHTKQVVRPPEPERSSQPARTGPAERRPIATSESVGREPDRDSRDQAMRRLRQSGGEERLFRDVKLHFKLRDWEGAVPLLEQLVEISPGSAVYWGLMARAMSRHPRLRKDAEGRFIEAIRLAPQNPQLHYWLGLYYESFGLKSRAIMEFRTTLRIDRNHKGARKHLNLGSGDEALGGVMKKLFG